VPVRAHTVTNKPDYSCSPVPVPVPVAPFGCADKPAEKHCWLICCERKTLFWLKKQAEKDGL
jgi:hypothetical protein